MKTYFLQVKEVIQETKEAITIEFWHPLSEQIKYKAGQFLTVIVPADNGKKVRRSYSMSTSPHADTAVGITVKRVKGGLVSNYLVDNVKKGDFIEVLEPMGNFFFEPDATKQRHVFLIGAGSGITPLMSIAKTILKAEPNSKVSLIYGNRTKESIIFRHKIIDMEIEYKERFRVRQVLSQPSPEWAEERGRITRPSIVYMLKNFGVDFLTDEFFVCGPEGMMDDVLYILNSYAVSANRIHREAFNAPMMDEEAPENETSESLQKRTVKVLYDGDEHVFEVEPHQSILEAALELDIDLPYSCQAGMCTACLGTCTSGKIKMDEEDALTENEMKKGMILTCVAHPMTDDVVIEID
jgi:ring-1,2-phenylacetyl-CoA epoxidase subunit PaaE